MNSKLYFKYSQELSNAQGELDKAKKEKDEPKIALAKIKVEQWQKAVNYLYIYGS